jgi:hypothetical protein
MSKYVSILEATQLTGKSQATIYRLIRRPASKDYIKHDNDTTIIDREYLLTVYPAKNHNYSGNRHASIDVISDDLLKDLLKEYPASLLLERDKHIHFLEDQHKAMLEQKDKQINFLESQLEIKDITIRELIHTNIQLIERDRESNIIIKSIEDKINKQLVSADPTETHQRQSKFNNNAVLDKVMYGVSFVIGLAALIFIFAMLWAYFSR